MINKKNTSQKGFTLIEVLVAVFILITAVVVPLTISSKGIFYSNVVRDQSVASYLAQEGMEAVRLLRDDTFLQNNDATAAWDQFSNRFSDCTNESTCVMYLGDGGITKIFLCGDGCELYVNNDRYTQEQDGIKSAFTRTVKTALLTNPNRMQVDVTVSWKTNTLDRSITVTNYLMPWQL